MNPFNWSGPQFLIFYCGLGLCLVLVSRWLRRRREGELPTSVPRDPYVIAFLRGGKNEVLRLAVVSLCDRGLLLRRGGETLQTARAGDESLARRPVERELLRHFEQPQSAASVFSSVALAHAAQVFEAELGAQGLVLDGAGLGRRLAVILPFWTLFIAVGVLKLYVAASRHRQNVGLLIAAMLGFTILFAAGVLRRRTAKGDAALADLRTLFGALRARKATIEPGGRTAEVALLLAVFGLAALPDELAWARDLYKQAATGAADGTTGASCGSACGSSCGGGGCGGGCGGCGS